MLQRHLLAYVDWQECEAFQELSPNSFTLDMVASGYNHIAPD